MLRITWITTIKLYTVANNIIMSSLVLGKQWHDLTRLLIRDYNIIFRLKISKLASDPSVESTCWWIADYIINLLSVDIVVEVCKAAAT